MVGFLTARAHEYWCPTLPRHVPALLRLASKGVDLMSVVAADPFNMHHTVTSGAWRGYRVTFSLTFFSTRKPLVQVFAARKGSRTITNPKTVADMLPFDVWPEFAQQAFRQRVGMDNNNAQERLF